MAAEYGAILSPKLVFGSNAEHADAAQRVELENGRIIFKGNVDFSPVQDVQPGTGAAAFPPASVQPGAVGDAEYSSLVVLPSGQVINCQIISNSTGDHDRINEINIAERWADFQLLDGWEGNDRRYYHLVTDASVDVAAAIELGVHAPRLGNLPNIGNSNFDGSNVLLGFSPNTNGLTIALDGATEENRQGLSSTILDNGLDPVNIFPFDPDNTDENSNYSPMWDAHMNMWTDQAIADGERRAITGLGDLISLMNQGLVVDFFGNNGPNNPLLNGLMPTGAIINCPVICQPFQGVDVVLTPQEEAQSIVELGASEANRTVSDWNGSARSFPKEHNVFLPSTISLDNLEDPSLASARLPLYKGEAPDGSDVYYIITEATSIELAAEYGAILSPKLIFGSNAEHADAAQRVELENGRIIFKGNVDFSPVQDVQPGTGAAAFPPASVQPGAVGDAEYSSLVVLPSGQVINCQIISNSTGDHDRINEINIAERWADFQLLDGWEGNDRRYYHLVTDASVGVAAAIELGVHAPRLGNLPNIGNSNFDGSNVLLGFSPNTNGLTIALDGATEENRQGLSSTILDNGLDPVNIFPFDPDNTDENSNYSPMWDAHMNMWTDQAIADGERRAITGLGDLIDLMNQGLVVDFFGNNGPNNPLLNGLMPTGAIINCPVICQPFQGVDVVLTPQEEAQSIVELGASEANRTVSDWNGSARSFPKEHNVFLPSTISLDNLEDPSLASARLPLYKGEAPDGSDVYYIITEATSIELAAEYGAILSPKLIFGSNAEHADAAQRVELENGRIIFKGNVDFSPVQDVQPGTGAAAFPPASVQPGAVGDAEYSSLVVLPSGQVINCQIISNSTGDHDRINEINIAERWADFQLLDGWEGNDRRYYHLVTDASVGVAAAIELGVHAPRLGNLPNIGNSNFDGSNVLLGFSPNTNGLTIALDGATEENRQGLSSTILDNGLDPVNIFPFDPDNTDENSNYSPMWDAHMNMWTDQAIADGERRAITGLGDLISLMNQGLVVDFFGNNGPNNPLLNGLMPTGAIINCPVICQPFQGVDVVLTPQEEAQSIVELGASEANRTVSDWNGSARSFPKEHNVFLPSTISLDNLEDPSLASARLPLYKGEAPDGSDVYYIITEATSIELAAEYGAILSPKLIFGSNAEHADAAQRVELENGRIIFKGNVDFSPVQDVQPGTGAAAFPPASVQPGAVGDAEYSSLVVLPSGQVINCQIISNSTGDHDRINEINIAERWADFQLLDGWEGNDRRYYHLVTDASVGVAAAIELGVHAPRLGNLPNIGNSNFDGSNVLLGFSPNTNGLTIALDGATEENRQGLSSTILDNGLDPVNIFPFDPDNTDENSNYSPMWDAHMNMWTDQAIADGERRAITGLGDLIDLMNQGLVVDFFGNNGPNNPLLNGLMPTGAIINCPVICQPFQGVDVVLTPQEEAQSIVELGASEANRTVSDWNGSARSFPKEHNVFLPSTISLDNLEDPSLASARLPLYKGEAPDGSDVYYIITEATSIELAAEYGAILSPKLIFGSNAEHADAAQRVELENGRIIFKGNVDFSPVQDVQPGTGAAAFPPASVQPGAVGDAEYSSLVVLPSGQVINCQIISNSTGDHDRINEINIAERWADFQLLDGWEGNDRRYYHLVTDASVGVAAAIELGVHAPRLGNLPNIGNSNFDGSNVLLGFSPNTNGLTIALDGATEENRQGLSSTILDNGLDPVNIFPFDPDNTDENSNYSPMWDAHMNMWTDQAIADGERRAITGLGDLIDLMNQGLVVDFFGNNGPNNPLLNGLMPTGAIINCPVICQPFQGVDVVLTPQEEAQSIVELGASEANRTVADWNGSSRSFPDEYNVFLPSTISLDNLEDPALASARLPLYQGEAPDGSDVYYIITEATSIELAAEYGAILSPKLIFGSNAEHADAAQRVELENGRIIFKGNVDFSPVQDVQPGTGAAAFPPASVQPGAVGDAEYSSLVVLPSGQVINCQIISNGTGDHDRINEINIAERWADFQLLDGWEGNVRGYYHLVTDASVDVAAAIELGVHAPRLGNLPNIGNSNFDGSNVLLGFSPNTNGLTIALDGATGENRQGLSSTILDNGLDPVNIFPFDPDNTDENSNYSPMWDAHMNMWTDQAIADGERRAITGLGDLIDLMNQGLVVDFFGNNGPNNPLLNGLMPTGAIINCPVICQPNNGIVLSINDFEKFDFYLSASPNPVSNSTVLTYNLPERGEVYVTIFDATGRVLDNLLNGESQHSGNQSVTWTTRNSRFLSSGIYYVRLKVGLRIQTIPLSVINH